MKALCALMPFPPLFNAKLSVVAISRASFDTRLTSKRKVKNYQRLTVCLTRFNNGRDIQVKCFVFLDF